MNITQKQIDFIKKIHGNLNEFHPADYYNQLIITNSSIIKTMAIDLGIAYKNKRSFIKELISMIEYIKTNNL